ncbi:hypothetical protein [Geminicoccus harenae]|uniref:hypothetical protein n=1 Tax=Geminicoccus harenae TaxID=2498453 RepID=UPI00168AA6DD|nr:hypothetical protein [Geminicoccus harenae]
MTKVTLPSALSAALQAAQDLESRIDRTQAALVAADARAERAKANRLEAELERDRLAGERDLAAASEALGEAPTTDTAELKKAIASADRRLAAERAEAEAALAAQRGLRLRLQKEQAERAQHLEAIEQAKGETRLALAEQASAILDRMTAILTTEFTPLAQADLAVGGGYLARCLASINLSEFGVDDGQPSRAGKLDHAMRSAAMPPEFARVDMTVRKLRAATAETRAEAEASPQPANDLRAA